MKIRTGFVSNSSSSSFMLAFIDDTIPCPACGKSSVNVLELFPEGTYYSDDSRVLAQTAREIKEYIKDNWIWRTDDGKTKEEVLEEDYGEILKEYSKKEEEGKTVALVQINYRDKVLEEMLRRETEVTDMGEA
jgi:hypothetical protein